MTKKTGRNDPCPCGSGKKYKQCCMLKEKEKAKHTPSGKRKFKATHIKMEDKSLSIFSRSTTQPQAVSESATLQKMKFRMAKHDFREKPKEEALPFAIPRSDESDEPSEKKPPTPSEQVEEKPGDPFKATEADFRSDEPSEEKPSMSSEQGEEKPGDPFKATEADFRLKDDDEEGKE